MALAGCGSLVLFGIIVLRWPGVPVIFPAAIVLVGLSFLHVWFLNSGAVANSITIGRDGLNILLSNSRTRTRDWSSSPIRLRESGGPSAASDEEPWELVLSFRFYGISRRAAESLLEMAESLGLKIVRRGAREAPGGVLYVIRRL